MGTSKLETKSNRWRKKQSSLVKQCKNVMMSSISPREVQTNSKAKRSFNAMYDERMRSLRTRPRQEKSKKGLSDSLTRPMSDGRTMGASSTYDRLMMSMGTQKGGELSSTRLQPQLTSSSLRLTQVPATASDLSDMFAGVMTGLEELRRHMTKRID